MSQADPWQEAADCERAAQRQTDPEQFAIYTHLRDLWIALANERNFLDEAEFQERVNAIGHVQDDMIANSKEPGPAIPQYARALPHRTTTGPVG
jgi:hypothetical protein